MTNIDWINSVHVSNMKSRNGNKIPNQFIVKTPDGIYFQSYQSVIAFIPNYKYQKEHNFKYMHAFLDESKWDYSVTTGKYRNIFLNETKKQTEAKIKSGYYELVDLNGGEI